MPIALQSPSRRASSASRVCPVVCMGPVGYPRGGPEGPPLQEKRAGARQDVERAKRRRGGLSGPPDSEGGRCGGSDEVGNVVTGGGGWSRGRVRGDAASRAARERARHRHAGGFRVRYATAAAWLGGRACGGVGHDQS